MAPKKNYTSEQMGGAIEAVRKGEKIASAAQRFGVPRITLYNKISGKSPVDCAMGPQTVLSKSEEDILVKWLVAMSERHFPVNRELLMESVQKIVLEQGKSNPFTNNKPGKKWFMSFLKRHPDITEKTAQNLTKSRDDVSEEDIRKWFGEITSYLEDKGLKDILQDPSRIFNTDESAFFLSPKAGRVLCKRGEKHLYNFCGDEKENLTVLVTANAAGQMSPPMIVFKYERVPAHISASVPDDWGIGKSESGWMCGSTFYEFITNIFDPWLNQQDIQKPILFFLDGHKSHLTLHLSNYCSANGIEIIALYPNSTHILQPMDLAVFRPLKVAWRSEVSRWQLDHLGQTLKKEHFAPVLNDSLTAISNDCIRNGFRAGGLFPFGPEYIDMTKIKNQQVKEKENDPRQTEFMKYLESEIVKVFSRQKLELFNKMYFQDRNTLEQTLPSEDESLFVIWAKNKQSTGSESTNILKHRSDMPLKSPAENVVVTSEVQEELNETSHITVEKTACIQELDIAQSGNDDQLANIEVPETSFSSIERLADRERDITELPNMNQVDYSSYEKLASSNHQEDKLRQKNISSTNSGVEKNTVGEEVLPSSSTPQLSTPQKKPLETALGVTIPTPFKNNLFWPEELPLKKKRKKEKIPFAVTSKAWQNYHIKKEIEKQKQLEEKEKRVKERQEKKILKEQMLINKKKKNINTKKKEEDSSSEDTDITYAESEDSNLEEYNNDSLEETEEREDINQSNRPKGCGSTQRSRQTTRRRKIPKGYDITLSNSVHIGQFVIIKYEGEYFPGKIENIDDNQYEISTMVLSMSNSFRWPEKPDKIWYKAEDIVEVISDPLPLNKRGFFKIKEMQKYLPDLYNI